MRAEVAERRERWRRARIRRGGDLRAGGVLLAAAAPTQFAVGLSSKGFMGWLGNNALPLGVAICAIAGFGLAKRQQVGQVITIVCGTLMCLGLFGIAAQATGLSQWLASLATKS